MKLLRLLLLLAIAISASPPGFGQSKAGPFTINASTSPCAVIGVSAQSTVGITVTGSFSATLQPEVAMIGRDGSTAGAPQNTQVTPSTSTTAQSTITAAGVYKAAVGGFDTFLVCVTSYASGTATIYLNTTTAVNAGLLGGGGGGSVTSVSGTAHQIDSTGGATPVVSLDPAVQIGSSASVVPVVFGQISDTGDLRNFSGMGGVASPLLLNSNLALSNTGGNLANGQIVYVVLTAVTAGSETKASPEAAISTGASCTGGNQCSVTVTLPTSCTSPVAPQTGCTVYSGSPGGSGSELKQATASACVNITTATCVIQTLGAGSAIPTANSTSVNPSPLCSGLPGKPLSHFTQTPFMWGYNPNGACWEDLMALEYNNSPLTAQGTGSKLDQLAISIFRPLHLDNTGGFITAAYFPDFINCLFCVGVDSGVNLASGLSTNQESAWGWVITNADNPLPTYDQYGGVYGEAHVGKPGGPQNSFSCNPAVTESCHYGIRSVAQTNNTSGTYGGGIGSQGVAGVFFNNNSGSAHTTNGMAGVVGLYQVDTAYNLNGDTGKGVTGLCYDATGGSSNGRCWALEAQTPITRLPCVAGGFPCNLGVMAQPQASGAHFGQDYSFFTYATNPGDSMAFMGGPVVLQQGIQGAVLPTQIQTPTGNTSLTVNCSATCTNTWTYKIVVKDAAGGWAPATAGGLLTTAVGAPTLSGATNENIVNLNSSGYTSYSGATNFGMYSMDVYRTTSGGTPATTGYIGSVNCFIAGGCSFTDNGVAISSPTTSDYPTPPAYNTSGAVTGYTLRTITNCKVNSVSPAACAAAPSGSFVVPTTTVTYTVNTSVVTINSEIHLTPRSDATGLPSAPTCVLPAVTSTWGVSGRSAGVSFTIALPSTTGTTCFDYTIVN